MDPERLSLRYAKEYRHTEKRKKEIFLDMKQSGRKPKENDGTKPPSHARPKVRNGEKPCV
jgi:hypothetical protein